MQDDNAFLFVSLERSPLKGNLCHFREVSLKNERQLCLIRGVALCRLCCPWGTGWNDKYEGVESETIATIAVSHYVSKTRCWTQPITFYSGSISFLSAHLTVKLTAVGRIVLYYWASLKLRNWNMAVSDCECNTNIIGCTILRDCSCILVCLVYWSQLVHGLVDNNSSQSSFYPNKYTGWLN